MGKISVELYGESHSAKIGVRIKGVAAGTYVDEEEISALLERRRAVKAAYSTPRLEKDGYEFVSGVENGSVTGDIVAEIPNLNTRSSDYPRYIPRPSHADYVSFVKDGLREITPGGGRFSGRMTAPLCIAGGIFKGILKTKGIRINAFVKSIGGIVGKGYFDGATEEEMALASKTPPYAITNGEQMLLAVESARREGDSLGGSVECVITGMPVGVGDFYTAGIESAVAAEVFGVPAVKGIEFGLGFGFDSAFGSEVNDPFRIENGKVVTSTNFSGGINGGISNGMPVVFRAVLRPTPSISKAQQSVDLSAMQNVTLNLKGRHDACIVPRAAAAIEAAAAIAVAKLTEGIC